MTLTPDTNAPGPATIQRRRVTGADRGYRRAQWSARVSWSCANWTIIGVWRMERCAMLRQRRPLVVRAVWRSKS